MSDFKILLVSSSILPYSGGSSVIVENLASQFSKNEMIVLGARGIKRPKIFRSSDSPEFYYFLSELSFFGRGARFFDWFRKMRLNKLHKIIERLISEKEITYVVGVYPNQFYCLAASRASKTTDIPFSSYFHNTYVENEALNDPNAADIQEEIFSNSRNIFVMSEGMQQFYEKKYKLNKFIPLRHTFDKEGLASSESSLTIDPNSKVKLVAIGNFNESNIEATRRLLNAISNSSIYELYIYTHVPKVLMTKRGLDPDAYHYKGSVRPQEIGVELLKYDICILTHGFTGGYGKIEYETIFPTRTIPFLVSQRPILAHSPKGSFLNQFLKEHNCAELVEVASKEEIIKSLDKICNSPQLQRQLVENALKASKLFEGKTVASEFKHHLERGEK